MTTADELQETDWRRRQAMIAADVAGLERLLAEELIWTHSSGKTDDKQSFLEKIAAKAVDYQSLEVTDDVVSSQGDVMIHHGTLTGRVAVDGVEKALRNRFLSVWQWRDGTFVLLAWQSTGF
jgi:ketosteroid isomerase-like protein